MSQAFIVSPVPPRYEGQKLELRRARYVKIVRDREKVRRKIVVEIIADWTIVEVGGGGEVDGTFVSCERGRFTTDLFLFIILLTEWSVAIEGMLYSIIAMRRVRRDRVRRRRRVLGWRSGKGGEELLCGEDVHEPRER